jgi:tetratricopeptide (TPR) repeat protein
MLKEERFLMKHYLFICSALILLSSCSTSFSELISDKKLVEINSSPTGASVYFYSSQSGEYIEAGKTPFILDTTQDQNLKLDSSGPVSILISQPGYISEHITIEKRVKSKVSVFANLKKVEHWVDPTNKMSSTIANDLGRNFQEIYRNIRTGRLSLARESVDELQKKYPFASILYDIKGSIYMLEGKKDLALAQYEKSLALSPENVEAQKIIQTIKR